MNSQQQKRYQKLNNDKFFLLGTHRENNNLLFDISGSTKNVYHVTIYGDTGTIFCTCPDAKSWAVKHNCICKHCLFVLYRVLRIFDNTNESFFDCLVFSIDELERIIISYEYLASYLDPNIVNDNLTKKYQQLQEKSGTEEFELKFEAEDLCGVCFLELEDSSTDQLLACSACNKVGHRECIEKWIASGQKICVYCRQQVWDKKPIKNGDYQNLS